MAPATVRRSPYKDFLQPALQRRFATASLFVLAIAYLQALFLANWSSWFWSWFPLGPTGFRAVSLFFCGIIVIILRISQYHPGLRTSDSGVHTFFRYAPKLETAETILTYTLSAFVFSFIYLWSLSDTSGLEFVTYFTADRARLNEKPLFLISHLVLLGAYQALQHLFRDVDRLSLGVARPQNGNGKPEEGDASHQVRRFRDQLPAMLIYTLNHSVIGIILSVILYPLTVRGAVWKTTLVFLRPIYSLPRSNMLPVSLPYSIPALFRCFLVGLILMFAWTAANTAFSLFLVKHPLKNGKALTSDSKDPNGSLLNGLKNKKLSIKCFAMWELSFIARDFPDRRKSIYEDIERKDGPMWSQVYKICLDTIKAMETNMDTYVAPPAPPASTDKTPEQLQEEQQKAHTTNPPRDEEIFQPIPQRKGLRNQVEKAVNQAALAPGQPSQLSPTAKRVVESAKQQLLKAQKEATGSEDTQGLFQDAALRVLRSPAGWPFRQHYRRRLAHAVFGAPYGEPSLYVNTAYALSGLAVHSLREDKYGHVQRDVAAVIRALTAVTKKLEGFGDALPAHWTDVGGERTCPEVEEVLAALRDALARLIDAFGPYARDLRLSLTDMRLAREAAGMMGADGEMREVGRGAS
ncbi:nucleoporin protein Ndc1-Nup [Chaetomium sp. MPI-CAGE-AT-0009]|nr:nucleoporin protein Ndc1-Nup [Chaetomium sp. MPI-CAGE-AT-0009]